ncbi:MAG: hypothetical protein R3F24_04405 [Gammaproteobacteria bacterium]
MRQPEWTTSASLDYQHQIVGDWQLKAGISASYTGKIYTSNDPIRLDSGPHERQLQHRRRFPRYTVSIWVRSLLDNDKPISTIGHLLDQRLRLAGTAR